MRIINAYVDETLFNKMDADKKKKNIASWAKYLHYLFYRGHRQKGVTNKGDLE